jgi:hypothetical protein
MNNKKFTHLLGTGVLASALILSGSAGTVFANEDSKITEETVTIVDPNTTSQDTITTTEAVEKVEAPQVDLDEPSLIPGDFFYFVKMITEKIRLAVTFDEFKEAQLLADFAAERIAEANILLEDGKTEEAAQLLKEAISIQDQAGEKLPETSVKAETSIETVGTKVESVELTEVNEAAETENVVQSKLANNIDSLLIVLEKVENEKAQQAILKNIQKSFEKLDKKLKKLEEANLKFEEKMKDIDEKLVSGQITVEEANREKTKLIDELNHKSQKIEEEEARDVEEINKDVTKEQEKKEEESVKEAKEKQKEKAKKIEEKQIEEAKKAEEKQREEAKKAEEKQREEAKKAEEKQREEAKKAEEKQREEAKKAEEKQREEAKKAEKNDKE